MDKKVVGRFIRWLDEATTEEIAEHAKLVKNAKSMVTTRYARRQIKFALQLMDQELLARLESSRLKQPG